MIMPRTYLLASSYLSRSTSSSILSSIKLITRRSKLDLSTTTTYRNQTRFTQLKLRTFSTTITKNQTSNEVSNLNTTKPFRVGIVGSGPGGFYTANRLFKLFGEAEVKIDMIEKLPIPHGLVRYGVAPDHPEVKLVMNKFDEVASHPNFSFYGNVEVGKQLSVERLRESYDAVVFAYGADHDKKFGIPGEEVPGVVSARSFVEWYNGSPTSLGQNLPDLSATDTAVVLGQGNVALDVARILLSPIDVLAKTDITEQALEHLSKSRINKVHIVGRRGPLQELREMLALPDTLVKLGEVLLQSQINDHKPFLTKKRALCRLVTLMVTGIDENNQQFHNGLSPKKTCQIDFLRSPLSFESESGKLTGIRFGINELQGDPPRAVSTGQEEFISCGLALRSIGYKSTPLPGLPFDSKVGVVPNNQGRVLANNQEIPGLYVSGWLKTGPVGVIVSTMMHANATADSIFADYKSGFINGGRSGLSKQNLNSQGFNPTSYQDWKKLEQYEFTLGAKHGKPREKVINPVEMLNIIQKL